ncbi:Crp/Fnr family transcriptional regulator [Actinocorallia populi]|uniref:Crp/Fnr family transcriptional regulator n=1 Tax=Actinocorallia populi TaxID=2079200 RepID=UPI000D0958EE|nr:Crp/Fnr family transcriptional regulator [Actinocorallia populi]
MEAPLTIVVRGWAKSVTRMPGRDDTVLRVHGIGDLIGDLPMLPTLAGHERLLALTEMEVLSVSATQTSRLFTADPTLHRVVGEVLIERLAEADRRSAAVAGGEAAQRVAWLLAELAVRHGEQSGQNIRIPVPLTQDELGQLVGTSRESVARALTFLNRRGFVRHGRRSYTVVDLDRLVDYGQWSEPPSGLQPVRNAVESDRESEGFSVSVVTEKETEPRPQSGGLPGFWSDINEQQQEHLLRLGRTRRFRQGDHLCHQGESAEHVLVIRNGWTKICVRNAEGQETVVAVRGPGELIGEIGTISGGVRSATVTALRPVSALSVSADRFQHFLREHEGAWDKVLATMNGRLEQTTRRIVENGTQDGTKRLARFVLSLIEGSGVPVVTGGVEIPALSQAELASCADTSKETVSRAFRNWREQGAIRTGRRRTVVLAPERLREYAGLSAEE